ncbi:hypothetical protein D3C79_49890 [compost metagenome]
MNKPVEEQPVTPEESPAVNGGIERELFGKWTISLRNLGGILSIITMCVVAVFNVYTTHLSVKDGGEWPSELTLVIVNIGPIICAWTWVNANKTISTIMQGSGLTDQLRNRLANVISTDKKQNGDNSTNGQ